MDGSFFVGNDVHEREITLADGSKHILHFKEVPAAEFRRYYKAESSEDEAVFAGSMARLIAASVCEPDGKPALTYEKAQKLKVNVMTALFQAVLDVNGFGVSKKESSPSEASPTSGT